MSRGPDAGTALRRAIERDALAAGLTLSVRAGDWQRWASATFIGARHALTLEAADGGVLDAWLAALPEAELQARGHLVADLTIAKVRRAAGIAAIVLEALTVER